MKKKRSKVERVAREISEIVHPMHPSSEECRVCTRLAEWHLEIVRREVRRARGRTSRHPRIATPVGVPCRIAKTRAIKRWFRGLEGTYEGVCAIVPGHVTVRVRGERVALEPKDVVLVPRRRNGGSK